MSNTITTTKTPNSGPKRTQPFPRPRTRTPAENSSAEELLVAARRLGENDPRADRLRERVVLLHQPLAKKIARRYQGRGEPLEDLYQAAMVGYTKAMRGYDPSYGKPFVAYLVPTVAGEVKRHFRDHTWAMRVSRSQQEERSRLRRVTYEFQQDHARTPTTAELARQMDMTEDEVNQLTQASNAYQCLSLEAPDTSGAEEESMRLEDHLGSKDHALELVDQRESLKPALARLPERDRQLLGLRFFCDHTQAEIADRMGCSQMHVSRLLSGVLERLRTEMGESTAKART
ncbi:SigB/SigF/SigG family RNA polymerase sigma factor [Nocardiopsis sp. NPDC058631]|uniref:SigB/SigF/SigG family RNA polymerase sigma factor n=1 Tax=Nocardiopsis sp. NPDC058631 TaxID=3346566 RepID=UPI00364902AB